MHGLLGHLLPMGMPREQSLGDRIRTGRAHLVRVAGVDFGYDPEAWHEHLRATNAGGYRWSNKHLGFSRRIKRALADPEWHRAVASLWVPDPQWQTAEVVALARGIATDRSFDLLPVLADALQDAGCDDEQILGHCRRAGPAQMDSWVIYLLLGNESKTAEPLSRPSDLNVNDHPGTK
jgi:hypothetical protein